MSKNSKSSKEDALSVTELNERIRFTLADNYPTTLKVSGEISNIKSSGGHTYLTLKDDLSQISVVCWKSTYIDFDKYKNGDDVIASGKIGCFTKQGSYQIVLSKIEKIGIGNLHEQLEQLKKAFQDKGYFDKKRSLPKIINKIGILTSSEGAALKDVLHVLESNGYNGTVYIKNCAVQGQNCPKSIEEGIEYFTKMHKKTPLDVLLVTRGGGSFEDLMGYSAKEVVKAIYNCPIITISAVGHEVDRMLSDDTADVRAATPSIAGQLISEIQKQKKDMLEKQLEKLTTLETSISNKIINYGDKLQHYMERLNTFKPKNYIEEYQKKLNTYRTDSDNNMAFIFSKLQHEIDHMIMKCDQYDITKTFKKGHVLITDESDELVTTKDSLKDMLDEKQKIKIHFADGVFDLGKYIAKCVSK